MTQNIEHYHRYHIQTQPAPEVAKWPSRFNVRVGKPGLAKSLLAEIRQHGWKRREVILSRPCMYGVFSGPVGGFAPRPQFCVGCLRCTTEFPEFVSVTHNPERRKLGDTYFTSAIVDTISYEALEGMIPVRGAGYRGRFGGEGWDGIWTDMSEIVRPTRDGIHGREFISTVVDIGYRPNFLTFDKTGQPTSRYPKTVSIPLPFIFDVPPRTITNQKLGRITSSAAESIDTYAVLPIEAIIKAKLNSCHIIPLVGPDQVSRLSEITFSPALIEMEGWKPELFQEIHTTFPDAVIILRIPFPSKEDLLAYVKLGVNTFHLLADFHGRGRDGQFVLDIIRQAHSALVNAGIRQEVTLLGSGGIIAAEHIPKAILCGLDAVALDTPILIALQTRFIGHCADRQNSQFTLPKRLTVKWGSQRLVNLSASWRDQLLEISGAMGLREIRRMRGEMGRAMFMHTLEADAFAGVAGYERR